MLELFSKRLKAAEENHNKMMEALMRQVPRSLDISSTQSHISPSVNSNQMRTLEEGIKIYNEWKNDLEGAGFGCRFYKPHIPSEADALAERIRDVIASYALDEFVRRATPQEKDLSLDSLKNIVANFEAMANAPALSNSNPIKEDDEVFKIENAIQRRRSCNETISHVFISSSFRNLDRSPSLREYFRVQ
ncbi:hypothetical protein GJ496_011358 [Pomphorhynchus laevis]|nr:hypothetical protein GJ496_011358 [Pomphorhynchus laevis]